MMVTSNDLSSSSVMGFIKEDEVFVADNSRALPTSASPFRRWGQSSFRTPKTTESQRAQLARRPSSLAASENDVYTKSMDDFNLEVDCQLSQSGDLARDGPSAQNHSPEPSGAVAWGTSFEKLLEDTAGIHTFAEFLKKEFSAENIYFWTACERYRRTESTADRATQAMDIFSKHLASGAPEPVNVDSQARNTAEDNLQTADRNLFYQAQKQIFNLMKFDSYQRFIRSDLYKKCVEAESKNQPLPFPGDKLDELLRTTPESPGPSKLKKSASNAEDRHRKSLLPWHRKTRCKSRDRAETDINSNKPSKFQSGNSLKPPMTNSASDIHSSRSSLSSFDANVVAALGSGPDDGKAVCLCRVILCDGATTIVQTRPNETVRQLVERLLEKRGIQYQFFDVIISGNSKAIDLESSSSFLAGKEVQIEQRVAFKLDLPDPKVISVKSKPKKALSDVLRPILHKYNYRLEEVQILHRETHEQLDMTLPVTVADGQRLQVVMLKNEGCRTDPLQHHKLRTAHNHCYQNQSCVQLPKNPQFPSKVIKTGAQQSTLDEITNKVFNELLQGKVESHANQILPTKPSDQCSVRSEDCASETSSVFDRLRRKDSNIPALKALRPKKLDLPSKCSVAPSEDGVSLSTQTTSASDPTSNGIKKPLIAKWKTGVKLQVTGRAENHEEFLEGLKRAQRARLEDQRGTEINSELPDFLKDKENLSVASKLRKVRANLSPVGGSNQMIEDGGISAARSTFETVGNHIADRPQPAPRLSIGKSNSSNSVSPMKVDMNGSEIFPSSNETEFDPTSKGPPPLPPKPKILPIKPSNWGQNAAPNSPSKIPIDITRRHLGSASSSSAMADQTGRNVYLDQPSSSFV